jgi:hypothetical protein
MPSAPHEILVMALRERPALLTTLLARLADRTVRAPLAVADSAVRFADVKEVRPDLLFTSPEVPWLVAEVQHEVDEAKRRKWPLAASVLVDEHGRMGELVVLTPSRRVARWARGAVTWQGPIGSRLTLRPVVLAIDLDTAEALLEAAEAEPGLALVAAWALQRKYGPRAKAGVRRALERTAPLPPGARAEQTRAILQVVSPRLATYVKELFMNLEALPESEAFKELMQALEGSAEARGKLEGARAALLRYLDRRGVVLTASERAAVDGCRDLGTLERWLDAAFGAPSDEALRAALFG